MARFIISATILCSGGFVQALNQDQQSRLAQFDIPLVGVSAMVHPITPVVPKNVASAVRVVLRSGSQDLPLAEALNFIAVGSVARAELSGPGLGQTLSLPLPDAPASDRLLIPLPPLAVAGDYTLSNIRVESTTGTPIIDVSPSSIIVRVIDQVLITSVRTRPLTLDEIRGRGVVLDSNAYLGFEFTVGVAVESNTVNLTLPVVFNRAGVPMPLELLAPPEPPRATVDVPPPPLPTFVPMLLTMAPLPGFPDQIPELTLPSGEPIQIPALLVIPGGVGYLKQFFLAQLFVANGAPAGSGLTLHDITGTMSLPAGLDLVVGTADDPLALPTLDRNGQTFVQPTTMPVESIGADGLPGTPDDVGELGPAEQGQTEFVLRGEREGFHALEFNISAVLDGLAVGPVTLTGRAAGGVLVRNPFFDMTFTVPSAVRRGEPFKVYATVTNLGQGIANDVGVTLDGTRLAGASIVGDPTQRIATLLFGDARTLVFNFVGQQTGQVVASYLHFDPNAAGSGELRFALAVDERGVAMSPDTLALPTSIDGLPDDVIDAAMRVLGQAWSNSNAPMGTLPAGVLRISKTVATQKALALSEAGLRMTLGQSVGDAVRDIALDFYGGPLLDSGFDQLLRKTEAGRDLVRAIGAALAPAANANGGVNVYERAFADVAASGPDVITVAVSSGGLTAPVTVLLADGAGRRTSTATASGPGLNNIVGAVLLPLGGTSSTPVLGMVTSRVAQPYAVQLAGHTAGSYDVSMTLPDGADGFIHATTTRTAAPGSFSRIVLDPARAGGLVIEEDLDGNGSFESLFPLVVEPLIPHGPSLLSATVVGPETFGGASPFGLHAALLFDRIVDESSAADADRYTIPNNGIQNAQRQLSGRIVFASLEQPEGPYVASTLSVSGIVTSRGAVGPDSSVPLYSFLEEPGAVVSGRVFHADGTPVTSGAVTYENNLSWTCPVDLFGEPQFQIAGLSSAPIGPDGRYEFRYVRQDACGMPWKMATNDPQSGARRTASGYVRAAGEQIVLDFALLGRGQVTGTVRSLAGQPVPDARVVAVSANDPQEGAAAVSNADGRFTISGVPVGQILVSAVKGAGGGRSSGRIDRAGGIATVDVTLDGGALSASGRVLREQGSQVSPIAGLSVVYSLSGGGPLAVATSGPDGRFVFEGVPVGSFRITTAVDTQHHAHLDGVGAAGDELTGQDLVVRFADPSNPTASNFGTVRGTIRLPSGVPANDVIVSIAGRGALSAADGSFEVPGIAVLPGVSQPVLATTRDGLRSGHGVAVLNLPGQIVDDVTIVLSGLGSVVFTVLDPLGQPLVGQGIGLLSAVCNSTCGCSQKPTRSDGTVRFDNIPLGVVSGLSVRATVGFTDVATASASILRDGSVATATLRFTGFGTVNGVVRDPDDQLAFGANVALQSRRFDSATCTLVDGGSQSVRTATDGTFHFQGVSVGPVGVVATHPFFPTPVFSGGALTQHGQQLHLDLVLAQGTSTIAGELSGTVFLPDGVTPAGAGVTVIMDGALSGVEVSTDAAGHFMFAEIFPEGAYTLSVRDALTGGLARESIFLRAGQNAVHDVRLKGKGTVRVRVVDATGQPVESAYVVLRETAYPNREFEAALDASNLGLVTFAGVFEGPVSAQVSDAFGRGGRAASTLPGPGDTIDIRVVMNTTGSVLGHFYMSDGTPIPYGSISLIAGGRTIGQTTTSGTGDVGAFAFDYVPAGPVEVRAEDPATARTGLAGGSVNTEGQIVTLDVIAQSLGTVEGIVTSNGIPQPGANVVIVSGTFSGRTMSDTDGLYRIAGVPEGRVVATASLGDGFLIGTASATLQGDATTLQLSVALRDSGRVEGRVVTAAGEAPPPSVVFIQAGGTGSGWLSTTTDLSGVFTFERVPSGLASLSVDVLGSIDSTRTTVDVPAGGSVSVVLQLIGVGSVTGRTLDAGGAPVAGAVTLSAAGVVPFSATVVTGADGVFNFAEAPAGPFTMALRVPGAIELFGTAAGTVIPDGQTVLDVLVQPSGTVRGYVLRSDGVSPAFGAVVRLVLQAGGGTVTLNAGNDGHFELRGVPLGSFDLRVTDQFTGGVALLRGLRLETNNGVVDAGSIVVDDTDPVLVSVTPSNGAVGVAVNQTIQATFSDPLASVSGVFVRDGAATLPLSATLSTDGLVVTFAGTLPRGRLLSVVATTAVTDLYGRHLLQQVTTQFTTVLPALTSISVIPAAVTLVGAGQQQLLLVTGHYDDGSQAALTNSVSFAPSNPAVIGVSSAGLIIALANGNAIVTVSAAGVAPVDVPVLVKSLVSIVTSPDSLTFIGAGVAQTVVVTGHYSDGSQQTLTSGLTLTSSDSTVVQVSSGGIVTSGQNGTAMITVEAPNVPLVQISVVVKTLTSIALSPDSFTLVGVGAVRTLTLTGTYSDGSTVTLSSGVTFVSSNPGVATVNQSGLVTSVAPGTAIVSASLGTLTPARATVVVGIPVLTVQKVHAGTFVQGQNGAVYTITVGNAANAEATTGSVTVTDVVPPGLTLVSMLGEGWECAGSTCTRSDALMSGTAYPPIAVTVSVSLSAPPQLTNTAIVSGGGSVTATATDVTTVAPRPSQLTIQKSHSGSFTPGQASAAFSVIVSNALGAGATIGIVTVVDTLPAGLSFVSMSGTGWQCSNTTCTRGDVLAAGSSYPPIAVVVGVLANATSPQVNTVSVSGGGSATAIATDTVTLGAPVPTILAISPKVIDSTRPPSSVVVTGFNLVGSTFLFTPALSVGAPQINGAGTQATLPITVAASTRGRFTLRATNAAGSADPTPTNGNTIILINALDDGDTDGDGYPDGLEYLSGSDPQDPSSVPNLALQGNAVSPAVSVSSTALDAVGAQTLVSPAVSVTNLALPLATQQTLISAAFTVTNTSLAFAAPVTMVSPAFSVSNLALPSAGQALVSSAFSVSNVALPPSPQVLVSSAFSVFNDNTASTAQALGNVSVTDEQVLAVRIDQPLGHDALVEGSVIPFTAVVSGATTATSVTFTINGHPLTTDMTAPYSVVLTVPTGVESLTFGATARTSQGVETVASPVSVEVRPDLRTTVSGRVVDGSGSPVADALVDLLSVGLQAEYFRLAEQSQTLPDLAGLLPDRVGRVTGVSMWNPAGQFGWDPYGARLSPDYAGRFTGWINVTAAGRYTFFLAVHKGARLRVNGVTVIDVPMGASGATELSGTVDMALGLVPIELTFFESGGNAELVLSYAPPDGEPQVIPPTALVPTAQPFMARTNAEGRFEITGVPTALKSIQVRATVADGAEVTSATSDAVMSLPSSGVNVGDIAIVRRQR